MTLPGIPEARDAAQQIVTLLMADERGEAVDLADEFDNTLVLALTLADLVAYVHYRWGRACGFSAEARAEAWQSLLVDVAEWRLAKEAS